MLLFGKTYEDVHDKLDEWQSILQSNHRVLNHNEMTVGEIRATMGEEAAMAAYFHILLDEISEKTGKSKAIATLLELLNQGQLFKYY